MVLDHVVAAVLGRTQMSGDGCFVVNGAEEELIRAAVLERGIRPVAVSRYLGISTAAVAQHLRACEGAA